MSAVQPSGAQQRIVKIRRDYNSWVASETLEDYALRFTPRAFRRWSEFRVANTAFGAVSFLALEAIGGAIALSYGFTNAFWAIVAVTLVVFLTGLPISYYAARYGVDMDLLTRGAGFGYIGSTITSLIYASFTFIFFALEAAIMALALELAFGMPLWLGYLVSSLVIIPLVTHGITTISRLQTWSQPLWLGLMLLPYPFILAAEPQAVHDLLSFNGRSEDGAHFHLVLFGAACTVAFALVAQIGEQVDFLRFLPEKRPENRVRWWTSLLVAGPGWIVVGALKLLAGAFLAFLALQHQIDIDKAVEPTQMYLIAFGYVFDHPGWALAAMTVFVIVSQVKINVTNAYAGSLAWSNFFARLTHSHPGRVVWLVFNVLIAVLLMQLGVFDALEHVLSLYANVAIAWVGALVADLVVNKPLGLSPKGIEFKRAHLYDINPVGVGAMCLASALGIAAHLGLMGPMAQAFSAVVAMVTAFITSPLIAWATKGRYYLARSPAADDRLAEVSDEAGPHGPYVRLKRCVICDSAYEAPDMAHCPAYQGSICSLCCSLDVRCGDLCKSHARLSTQWQGALRRFMPRRWWPQIDAGLGHFLLLMLVIAPVLAAVLGLLYRHELEEAVALNAAWMSGRLEAALHSGFLKVYAALLMVSAMVAWWLVLAHRSREVAQEESNRQTRLLMEEIESHRRTDAALQLAKQVADKAREQADQASQAKTRYVSNISHELRTPLNSILGYAQLLQEDPSMPAHQAHAIKVILRGGEHLLSLIEGTLDVARIEAGKLTLDVKPLNLRLVMEELAALFELQAQAKGLAFRFEPPELWPQAVRADDKRLRQILINLLGNAVKFTSAGSVTLRVQYGREMAVFEVCDTGPGMTTQELDRVFEPFARGSASSSQGTSGAGLGLTISRMLTNLMGGEMTAESVPGQGTLFRLRLFLPELHDEAVSLASPRPLEVQGYAGPCRTVLVVDNEEDDRQLLHNWLTPLGFQVRLATHGEDALAQLSAGLQPDAVFMDLAMPGMDGWETLARLQNLIQTGQLVKPPVVAVVSANAFDKGLENPVGLPAQDFLVKPVRRDELLRWLGDRLMLNWVTDGADSQRLRLDVPATAPSVGTCLAHCSLQDLLDLRELARLGYYRGFIRRLDALCPGDEAEPLRRLAREFRFETIEQKLQEALYALESR